MLFFHARSVRAKLTFMSSLVLVGLLVIGGVGAVALVRVQQQFHAFGEGQFSTQTALVTLRQHMGNVRRYEKDMLLNIEAPEKARSYQGKWLAALQGMRSAVASLADASSPERAQRVDDLLARYEAQAAPVLLQAINGQIVTGTEANALLEPAKKHLHRADPLLDEIAADATQAAADSMHRVDRIARTSLYALAGAGGLTALLLMPLMLSVMRSVTRPLDRAVHAAERVAGGDLSQPVDVQGLDEFAKLLRAMAQMQQRLATLVGEVRLHAQGVATAGQQLAMGNDDLSQRSERQAGSLQQTAAAMLVLETQVVENARHAGSAQKVSSEAAELAQSVGASTSHVVANMQDLEQRSRRMTEIVDVIDGIAFQTNILALNAAVEAARAGDQGRGFAVVASEVRALASRSADAAREIKHLIHDSTSHIAKAAQASTASSEAMDRLLQASEGVSRLIGDIARQSRAQRDAIGQIGAALTDIDNGTQQNVALVEQSAAASASLRDQAANLLVSVSQFRLSPGR
jgi:methyl-accepting chemotaxis protein